MQLSRSLLLLTLLGAAAATTDISALSSANSRVECPSTQPMAGYPVTCTAILKTAANGAWGDVYDACKLRFAFCPVLAEASAVTPIANATHIADGYFQITFYPLVSGENSLTAAVEDVDVAVSPASITVRPAAVKSSQSTSVCNSVLGPPKCTVDHKDAFGNIASSCATYTTAVEGESASTCTLLL